MTVIPDQFENQLVPIFKTHSVQNEARTKSEGRPIFEDIEIVEIRTAGNKQTVGVFPAHEVWKIVDQPDGSREPMTYAMRWPELYKKFKSSEAQVQSGTPLSEAPFLSQAKRYELKALNIHTVEALASIDGHPLKQLGMGGREMKNQASAYLAKASGSAVETRLAAENESLRQQLTNLQQQFNDFSKAGSSKPETSVPAEAEAGDDGDHDPDADEEASSDGEQSPFEEWEDVDIKAWIESEGGQKPKGNPNHKTLVRLADELNAEIAKKNGNA